MLSIRCIIIFSLVTVAVYGQRRKIISGNLDGIGTQDTYELVFDYEGMRVGAEIDEVEYLKTKEADWEAKEEGQGVAFVRKWFGDRNTLYTPAFITGFQKFYKARLGDDKARYTLIIKTMRTEPGWYAGVMGHPAELDGECWVVESGNLSNVIAKIAFAGFVGKVSYGGDFEMTTRIQSAYEILGNGLGDFIKRKSR
jgi:hypothetical protein